MRLTRRGKIAAATLLIATSGAIGWNLPTPPAPSTPPTPQPTKVAVWNTDADNWEIAPDIPEFRGHGQCLWNVKPEVTLVECEDGWTTTS